MFRRSLPPLFSGDVDGKPQLANLLRSQVRNILIQSAAQEENTADAAPCPSPLPNNEANQPQAPGPGTQQANIAADAEPDGGNVARNGRPG